jgi:ribose transport system substrate-binding protein
MIARRLALLAFLAASAALSLPGCGRKETGTGASSAPGAKKIYLIVKASESEFWQIVIEGAKQAARRLNVNLIAQAPVSEADVSKQIAIMETAIAARPDAIILAPTVADSLVPAAERAMAAGIPVIVIDSAISTGNITSYLASDNVALGRLAADRMAEALQAKTGKPEGEVACVTFMSGVGSLEARKRGFTEQMAAKYPGIKVVAWQDAQGKQGTTLNIVQNFLTAYPGLKGVFANNVNSGDETVRALDMKKRKDLAVVLVDSGPQEVWGIENGYVDFLIVQKPWSMAQMSVEYALKAVAKEKLPKVVDTGIMAITPAMFKSGEADEFLKPVEFHKKKRD